MASLQERINDYTNFGSTDNAALADWFGDSVKEVQFLMPKEMKLRCADETTFDPTSGVASSSEPLAVFRATDTTFSAGKTFECRAIPYSFSHKAKDPDSYEYATASDPVYYYEPQAAGATGTEAKIMVLPASSSNVAKLYNLVVPAFATSGGGTYDITSGTSIANFPDEVEHLIILSVSMKALIRLMSDKSSTLPSDISAPALEVISTALPSYSAPSAFTLPSSPPGADIDFSDVGTLTGYIKPTFTIPSLGSITDMVLPSPPAAPTVPTLTTPEMNISLVNFNETVPTYNPVAITADFADVEKWINQEEDSEMVAARVSEIGARVTKANAEITDSVNKFNQQNTEYQAKLQIAVQDTQAKLQKAQQDPTFKFQKEVQDYTNEMQKYQAEVGTYQAQVNTEVQRWNAEVWGKAFNEWQVKYSSQLQEFNSDIQNESARIQNELADYQAEVGKAIQKYQAETGYDLGKYQADVQAYVQKYQNDLTQNTTNFTSDLNKYQAELQKVSATNADNLGQFSARLQNYSAIIQKHSTDYQWLSGQYQMLSAEYQKGLQLLTGGGQPQQGG
tara:strand:+ start:10933 stop:12624 length:1692 start_codon:yes stop_codon:yes gene_type:complete